MNEIMDLDQLIKELEIKYKSINKEFMDCKDSEEKKKIRDKRGRAIAELNYYRNIAEDKCGYWNVCSDHYYGCACSPSAKVSQGFDYDTYRNLRKELYGLPV